MTVTELAEASEVSEASVIRFARKIGHSGYYQMKIAIVKSLCNGTDVESFHGGDPNDVESVKERALDVALSNIRNSYQAVDTDQLVQAVELISQAACIYFFAAGNSLHVALDASYKLGKLGYRSFCESVPERAVLQARNMTPGDIAFGISRSGGSKVVNLALKIVHRKGLPAIALTNYRTSPVVKWCEHVLLTSSRNTLFAQESSITRLSECALIDLLFYLLLFRKNASCRDSLSQSEGEQSAFSL